MRGVNENPCFGLVDEVLRPDEAESRANVLAQFIRIAKELDKLNNLNSAFAIVSALQSVSIDRLEKTWSCLTTKNSWCFFKEDDFEKLKEIYRYCHILSQYFLHFPFPLICPNE